MEPSPSSKLERWSVYLLYMLLWIVYGILNQYNSIVAKITFDPTTVVWSQEVIKIVLSLCLFFVQDGGPGLLFHQMAKHWTMLLWYLIPAGLYAFSDVLTYINLRSFDPATLHLLGELKLVVTAIVHQYFFGKMLNRRHWAALAIVTAGCVLKAVDSMSMGPESSSSVIVTPDNDGEDTDTGIDSEGNNDVPHPTAFNFFLLGVHIAISTVAGVFNEKLLKDKPSVCINLQNICLYINGILFLTLGILAGASENKSVKETLSPTNIAAVLSEPLVLAMAVIMSVAGIVTGRFLKVFDSIRKSVAVALVVVSLPLLSLVIFGTPITGEMVVSLLLVVFGMHMYISEPPPKAAEDPTGAEELTSVNVNENEEDEAELFLSAIPLPGGNEVVKRQRIGQETSMLQELPDLPPSVV